MQNQGDIYKYAEVISVTSAPSGQTVTSAIGMILAEYEVRQYLDLRNLTHANAYIVTCKQRLIVPNTTGLSDVSNTGITAYTDYPARLVTSVDLTVTPAAAEVMLLDYSPKTINTSVTTSTASSDSIGSSSSISSEQTTGRSIADTSTYEVNASIGFFGEAGTGSVGGSHSSSHTKSSFSQNTAGTSSGSDLQRMTSGSSAMSIKDWASYASITDPSNPTWVWAQEYPWDVIQFHNQDADAKTADTVALPDYIQARLVDPVTGQVFPPSQLSLFGVNFLSVATWLVQLPQDYTDGNITASFRHQVQCAKGAHEQASQDGEGNYGAKAWLDTWQTFTHTGSQAIDMVKLALDPVVAEGSSNGAVVGFLKSQFLSLSAVDSTFTVLSGANNVMVKGGGFNFPSNNDTVLSASLSNNIPTLDVYFKIVSPLDTLTLYIKNWTSSASSLICLKFIINGNAQAIYRHVDAAENAGGSENVTTVILRNLDFTSSDFYDYLVQGLNHVAISISASDDPTGTAQPGTYYLRALAIG